jgi:hypothetical protein
MQDKVREIKDREDRKVLKLRIKEIKRELKRIRKAQDSPSISPGLLQKCSHAVDSATLALCAPLVKRSEAIGQKREDPEGYKADVLVRSMQDIISHCQQRVEKGKSLKPRHVQALAGLQETANIIAEKELGTLYSEAKQHAEAIQSLLQADMGQLPTAILTELEGLTQAFAAATR